MRRNEFLSSLCSSVSGQTVESFRWIRLAIFNIACGLIFEETVKLQEEQTTDCVYFLVECCCWCCWCHCTPSHTICVRLLLANLSPRRNMLAAEVSIAAMHKHRPKRKEKKYRMRTTWKHESDGTRSTSHKTMWWYWTCTHRLSSRLGITFKSSMK